MQIFSIYYTHKPGGFCKRLYRLLNSLALAGHQVTYLSLDQPPPALNSSINWIRIPFPLKARSGILFWATFFLCSSIYCFCLSFRNSTGCRWLVFSPFYATLLAPTRLILGLPLICFIRSKLLPASESEIFAWVEILTQKICFKVCDKIIVQTRANLELAQSHGFSTTKVAILPNSIDKTSAPVFNFEEISRLQVLTTGVFNKKKNLDFLCKVWSSLSQICEEKKLRCPFLRIVGVIRDLDFVKELPKNIQVIPWCEDITDIYLQSHIYLHPSLHEGMPNSVLEAMGFGLLTFVAQTPELLELVGFRELSFDIDKPRDLAERLLELQNNRGKMDRLRGLTMKRAEELCFDWDERARELAVN